MIQGKWFPTGSDISVPLAIRNAVFGQGRDDTDDWAQQVVVYDGDVPAGTARLYWQDGAFVIGLLGVSEGKRHCGFGDLLVRLCLFKALSHGQSRIDLVSPEKKAGFFAGYGFKADKPLPNGDVPMSIQAWEICLDHCGGDCKACR